MNPRLLILPLLMFCLASLAQDTPHSAEQLKKVHPKVQWHLDSATSIDIDCDGRPDTFYWGLDPEVSHTYYYDKKNHTFSYPEISLGFEFANDAKPQKMNIPFLKNTGYYGFRSEPKTIEVQPLACDWEGGTIPGCLKKDRCESMWIRDGQGFEAFVFWDAERKQVGWIRH